MVGAEPLWRLGHASVFWEYGKYAVSFLLILALLKQNRLPRADKKPFLYFCLLLPSIFMMPGFDRQAISFNLSGPFTLAVATMFFSTVKLNRAQLANVLTVMLAPIVGCLFLATSGTLRYEHISFRMSTAVTSAGYGPNQISSILGLGVLLAILFSMIYREQRLLARLMVPMGLWLAVQCALTYSRGGLWTMFGGLCVAFFYLLRDERYRVHLLAGGAAIAILTSFVIMPKLEAFTMGTLTKRFKDFDTSGRSRIVESDWDIFKKNPIMGVGPGQSNKLHAMFFRPSSAHTEYSRMLAEHGSLGVMALVILLFISMKRVVSIGDPVEKAIVLSFTVWALIFMAHSAMRLAAPSFIFALGSAVFSYGDSVVNSIKNDKYKPKQARIVRTIHKRKRF
jgi:hypothetical protein